MYFLRYETFWYKNYSIYGSICLDFFFNKLKKSRLLFFFSPWLNFPYSHLLYSCNPFCTVFVFPGAFCSSPVTVLLSWTGFVLSLFPAEILCIQPWVPAPSWWWIPPAQGQVGHTGRLKQLLTLPQLTASQNSFCGGDRPWGRGRTLRMFHQGISEQFLLLRLLLELPVVPRMPGRRVMSWSSYFLPWLSILWGPIECMISLWAWLFLVGWGYVASSRSCRIFHTIPLLLRYSKSQSLPCVGVENETFWMLFAGSQCSWTHLFFLVSFSQWINLDDFISSPCWSSLNFSRPKFLYFVLPTSLSSLFSLSSVSDTTFEFEKSLMYCLKHI